jgi:hypothetical protein
MTVAAALVVSAFLAILASQALFSFDRRVHAWIRGKRTLASRPHRGSRLLDECKSASFGRFGREAEPFLLERHKQVASLTAVQLEPLWREVAKTQESIRELHERVTYLEADTEGSRPWKSAGEATVKEVRLREVLSDSANS